MQKLCGRDEAAGLSQARLAHEVERFQRMRVAELVEETAKELQERGGAEQGDTVNMWCVSAMEKAAAGCSPLGIPRAGSAPEGYRCADKEFEVLICGWACRWVFGGRVRRLSAGNRPTFGVCTEA